MLLIDWFSLIVICFVAFNGFLKGFTKEIFSLASWIFSLGLAWFLGPLLFAYVEPYIVNDQLKRVLSFFIIFIGFFILFRTTGLILSKTLNLIGLSFLDKLLGFVSGFFKSAAILASLYILILGFLESQHWWIESYSRDYTLKIERELDPFLRKWQEEIDVFMNKENVTFTSSL